MVASHRRLVPPRARRVSAALIAIAFASCQRGPPPVAQPVDATPPELPALALDPAARASAIERGKVVIARHECTRCHTVDGMRGVGRPFDCVSCHVFIKGLVPGHPQYASMTAKWGKDVIDRYVANIDHLLRVPDLTSLGRRVQPASLDSFLAAPHDLRPHLGESMIRNVLSAAERRALVEYFAAVAGVPIDVTLAACAVAPDRLAQGKARVASAGCTACHAVGNEFPPPPRSDLSLLAPNLRFARERMNRPTLVAWTLDPKAVWPPATMPKLGLGRADAELIADYLLCAPIAVPPAPPPPSAVPPPAPAPVGWEEVKERVFGKVCVHCHMNDHEKDRGPGNQGGLGFAGTGLAMRTYEMLVRGSKGPDGARFSVLEARPGEPLPRMIAVLVARKVEGRRDDVGVHDAVRPAFDASPLGMPLGLPASSDEEIGLVRRWIADGCPGPTKVTGRPGISDGLLVPDGPIAKNHGCEVRPPADPPPPWAVPPPADASAVR